MIMQCSLAFFSLFMVNKYMVKGMFENARKMEGSLRAGDGGQAPVNGSG